MAIEILATIVAVSAIFSALIGLFVLEYFFRDQLRNLFDNTNYFIYLSLVLGYVLYAAGELSYYLISSFFSEDKPPGIQDLYWLLGGVMILISFVSLTITRSRESNSHHVLIATAVSASVLAAIVYLLMGTNEFYSYIYPFISALIVGFSSVSFWLAHLFGRMATPLQLFFLASSAIFVADIFFGLDLGDFYSYVSNVFYMIGYSLSCIAFVVLKQRLGEIQQLNKKGPY